MQSSDDEMNENIEEEEEEENEKKTNEEIDITHSFSLRNKSKINIFKNYRKIIFN